MNRFFVHEKNINKSHIVIDRKDDVNHISKVLRLNVGDKIEVSDGKRWEYIGEISYIDKNQIEAQIIDKSGYRGEPFTKVTLFQGIPKKGKMELIIQKNVEIGVNSIVPVAMDRSIGKLGEKASKKLERYNLISESAAKQCKRGIIPEILEEISFNKMIKQLGDFDLVVFPYENEENLSIKDYLLRKTDTRNFGKVAIIIGPEGGFSDEEVKAISSLGIEAVSLGKTILRTETAGIVALSMIMYQLEM